ncbi:MAG TPA: cysteine peptidase family C39 domain-containing protein [Candidatus Pacearchaeota archaeon]|nr:cysteine peptidase family C39 domain-containing protein [Candidatus Pacearchaeota archaeon]HPJ86928.1 cysteine peptidase family C39 domain-containing protein [Candidatus Pacearchaeota archaeon]HQF82930.1 cysteine peptidase family C39 domain-containing protein [Candidatus Pacearchaeota archaeon]HQI57861.1 cysteine peptidase family C39 domain-containing protein [Candidatus Pacearchaeota archaeon]HQJ57809.1 cysteine peptidase family C39 domain-containing protein [Candidatus Pacearchaeota archae
MKKILKFPEGNKQINLSSCGPNAMKQVILYKIGLDIPEYQLINMSCCSTETGTPVRGMIQISKNFNLNHKLKHNASIDDIIYSINTKNPVILLIQEWKSGHYVVANGYDTKHEKVFYYDPLYGKTRSINYSTLNKNWHGLDVFHRNRMGIFFED